MSDDRLITVAIHTYEKALMLKKTLEHEGIFVTLQNVNLSQPVISPGVRIRIKEQDLALALRIIENIDIFNIDNNSNQSHTILVPIDFTDYSINICPIAFKLAQIHKSTITFIHSFIDPYVNGKIQLSDSYTYDTVDGDNRNMLEMQANEKMSVFLENIKKQIKLGQIPPIKYSYKIVEGVPEEVINEYAKEIQPLLIVMGVRNAKRRERELIGSVSAEVLDSCRFTTLTIPDTINSEYIYNELKHVIFISSLSQDDILALDVLLRLFNNKNLKITITHISEKKLNEKYLTETLLSLKKYCENHYSSCLFDIAILSGETILDDIKKIDKNNHIDVLSLANKKKNIFARLFNPSLAHRILFNTDVPMVVVPI